MALIGFAGIIFGGVIAGLGGKIGKAALPVSWFYILIVLAAAMMLISTLGIISIHKYSRYGTCFFLFLTIILLICIAVVMTTLILYANQSAGALQGTVQGIQTELESFLLGYAIRNPEEWKSTQGALDCCGVNFETLYDLPQGKSPIDVLTGPKCTTNTTSLILGIIQAYPTYNSTVQSIVDQDPSIGDKSGGFFCIANILQTSKLYTIPASVASGLLVLIQFISIVLVFVLFCNVREADGGFAVLDEEYTPLKSSAAGTGNDIPEPNSGTGGGVFLKPGGSDNFVGQAQQFAGRMSMRMGFTPHSPPPNRIPNTPMMSSGFGQISPASSPSDGFGGSGLPPPNAGGLPTPNSGFSGPKPPPPSFGSAVKDFGSRMSLNLKQAFSHGPPSFGAPPPSFGGGPPPSFGGGGGGMGGPPMPNLGGGSPPMPSFGGPPMPNLGGGSKPPPPAMSKPQQPPPPAMSKPTAPAPAISKPQAPAPAPAPSGGGGGGGAKNDPKYKKYIMMEKCNLPEGAIRQKMNLDGLSEAEQNAFFR